MSVVDLSLAFQSQARERTFRAMFRNIPVSINSECSHGTNIVVTKTVKRLNILQLAHCKDQNKGAHKGHGFVSRQVNCKELESLRLSCLTDFEKVEPSQYLTDFGKVVFMIFCLTDFNTCYVIPDTKQKNDPSYS